MENDSPVSGPPVGEVDLYISSDESGAMSYDERDDGSPRFSPEKYEWHLKNSSHPTFWESTIMLL